MKGKHKIGLVLCSLVVLTCLGSFGQAATEDLDAFQYTYIRAESPDTGSLEPLIISGTSGAECIVFLKFRLWYGPRAGGYSKAELALTFSKENGVPNSVLVEIINCTDNSWDPYTITWNNAPNPLGTKIGDITLTNTELTEEDKVLKYFDITSTISGAEHGHITFVIFTDADTRLCVETFFREDIPYIRYIVPDDAIPSYNLFIILGIVSLLSILLNRRVRRRIK